MRTGPNGFLQRTECGLTPQNRYRRGENAQQWDSRSHFFSAAAEAMRRILMDNGASYIAQQN